MDDERERKWAKSIKKAIKDKIGLELKAETIEELKHELDRVFIIIRDYNEIVRRVYWMKKERDSYDR